MTDSRKTDDSIHCPDWLGDIGDIPDHYHGFRWSPSVLPNNILFFLRQDPLEMRPEGVTHCLHSRYEMVIAYEGEGLVCIEDRAYKICPGDALLVKPGTFHRYFGFGEDGFTWLFITFELDAELSDLETLGVPRVLTSNDMKTLSEVGRRYIDPAINEQSTFEIALRLGRIISAWEAREAINEFDELETDDAEACELLRTLTTFVNDNMDQAIRIDDLAVFLGKSGSYLRKKFRDHFGISLGRFLQKSRLARSLQLIDANDQSISEIAQSCGFESVHSFSQSFNRALGMSPTAYRGYLKNKKPPIKVPSGRQGDNRIEPAFL